MSVSVVWDVELVAASSIVHGGMTQATTTLFRRELLPTTEGFEQLPVISGNALRSALRRLCAELFIDALDLEGQVPVGAAAVLLNGGSLAKSRGAALTGARRAAVRRWVPPVGLFGGASTGVVIDGCVRASKLIPVCADTALVTGIASEVSVYDLLQVEDYSHTAGDDDASAGAGQMRYSMEVLTTGTRLWGQVQLDHADDLQYSLFAEALTLCCRHGVIGGRINTGHGRLTGTTTPRILRGTLPDETDWRATLHEHREEVLAALEALS